MTALGFFAYGIGIGVGRRHDVEGAEVEREDRSHDHAALPRRLGLGGIGGAAVGVPMAAVDAPLTLHVAGAGVLALVAVVVGARALPPTAVVETHERARSAWRNAERWPSGSWCWRSPPSRIGQRLALARAHRRVRRAILGRLSRFSVFVTR